MEYLLAGVVVVVVIGFFVLIAWGLAQLTKGVHGPYWIKDEHHDWERKKEERVQGLVDDGVKRRDQATGR